MNPWGLGGGRYGGVGLGEVDGCFSRGLFSHGNAAGASTGEGRGCSMVVDVTSLFSVPTFKPSRISRASSEWPTSSKASVASWPPTSRRTSSPPLCIAHERLVKRHSESAIELICAACNICRSIGHGHVIELARGD